MTRNGLISTAATLAMLLGALSLCGCASDEVASRILVEPERFLLYNCPEIATATQANMTRQRELEALMVKAGPSTGGQIASNLAYRPEYNQLRGEMVQLRKAAADKNCRSAAGAVAPGAAVSAPPRRSPSEQIIQ